jgi:hypothetical protein
MLPQLRIASPCSADWEKMAGDDRVRYCDQCNLNVYNFSAMSSAEIEQLLSRSAGRKCGRLYQRPDGTVLTTDCPVGFRARMRHVSRAAGAALAAMMSVMPVVAQNAEKSSSQLLAETGTAGAKLSVVDPTGAVIPGASIVISEQTSTYSVHGDSDYTGSFETFHLRPGAWKIAVYKAGFAPKEITVTLRDRDVFEIVMELPVAIMGEVVVVEGPTPSESTSLMPDFLSHNASTQTEPPKARGNKLSRVLHKLHF